SAQQVQIKTWLTNQQRDLESCKDVLHAVDDIEFASAKEPKTAVDLLTYRAMVLADRGQHRQVAETAERLLAIAPDAPVSPYNVACSYARCVPLVAPSKRTDELTSDQLDMRQLYVARAVAALAKAVERGFANLQQIEADTDLAAIRSTEGYREVVA